MAEETSSLIFFGSTVKRNKSFADGSHGAAIASLPPIRCEFGTVVLPNSKIIVIGGVLNGASTNTTEIYSPITRTWTAGPSMKLSRIEHSCTYSPTTGLVYVFGGWSSGQPSRPITLVEVYDYKSNTWFCLMGPLYRRFGHAAVGLNDGKILLTGGRKEYYVSDFKRPSSSYIFCPKSQTLVKKVAPSLYARMNPKACVLPSGNVMVVGGGGRKHTARTSVELYNVEADRWDLMPNTLVPHFGHTMTLFNDEIVIAGNDTNEIEPEDPEYDNRFATEIFSLATGRWRLEPLIEMELKCWHGAVVYPPEHNADMKKSTLFQLLAPRFKLTESDKKYLQVQDDKEEEEGEEDQERKKMRVD